MNGNTPPSFQHIGALSPFFPALGPEAKLFDLNSAQANHSFPSLSPATFAPLVPPTSTQHNSTSSNGSVNGSSNGGSAADNPERNTPEYLQQLLKDKRSVQELGPTIFQHVDRILDDGTYISCLSALSFHTLVLRT